MAATLSTTYQEAREAFLAAAASAGAAIETHPHPSLGPDVGALAVDVARLGNPAARSVLLLVSGTHGVEGYCGSALQTEWLHQVDASSLPAGGDIAVVLIHALNPYGMAWVRRVNEDNVDLNRNFVDWTAGPPANTEYDSIAHLLVPASWDADTQQSTTLALLDLVSEIGLDAVQAIISRGQYAHPTGVFHGGSGPVWSNRWLHEWAATNLATVTRLGIIDLHTGLGPWGHGELIGHEPSSSDSHRRALQWWGDVRSMTDGDSVSAVLEGDWFGSTHHLAPKAEITAVALEYGTIDPVSVLQALRADAWLHAHGDLSSPEGDEIRSQVRAAFIDDAPAWIETVWTRFAEVSERALSALRA